MGNYTKILGYDIYNKGMKSFMEDEVKWDSKQIILSGNPEVLNRGLDDKKLFERFTNENTVIVPDGISLIAISRLKKFAMREKIAGIEVLKGLLKEASEKNKKVFVLGAEKSVLESAIVNMKTEYQGINIVGYNHGFFEDSEKIIEKIKSSSPDLLITALGCPRQEEFLYDNMDEIDYCIGIGVGGSIDIIGGKTKRAPKWMIKIGMEWAYRTIKEPFRLKRLGVIPKFILKGIKEKKNG